MKCTNCGCEVEQDMLYCPECGCQLKKIDNYCQKCHSPLVDGATICPVCGYNNGKTEDVDQYKGYWKKPILWIILLALVISSIGLLKYIETHPLNLPRQESSQETTSQEAKVNLTKGDSMNAYANNQDKGDVTEDDDYIYYVNSSHIYRCKKDNLSKTEDLDLESQGYLSVVDGYLYYCDMDYNYYAYNLKSKVKTKLLDNIYYPVIYKNIVYYQLDEDGESIHSFDLKTKKDIKLNNEHSYSIQVDEKEEKLYYQVKEADDFCLKRMDLDGKNSEMIYAHVSTFLIDDHLYVSGTKFLSIDKKTRKETQIKDIEMNATAPFYIINNRIIYLDSYKVYSVKKDGSDKKVLFNGKVNHMQSVGGCLLVQTFDNNFEKTYYIIDTKGQYQKLSGKTDNKEEPEKEIDIPGLKES